MTNFSFVNDINQLLKMDDPVTKGPMPRWQSKGMEMSNSSLNGSKFSGNSSLASTKTPNKRRTPAKTPGSANRNNKSNPNTPKPTAGGDRFIPVRSSSNFALGNYLINKSLKEEEEKTDDTSPCKENILVNDALIGGDPNEMRILAFKKKAPAAPDGYVNPLRVMYSQSKSSGAGAVKGTTRYIPHAPERVLDAPDIVDDYYLNLVDWSSHNIVAVALANCVFLWNADSGSIQELVELEAGDYACSVAWYPEGNHLAIGTFTGTTQIWDCASMRRLRTMQGHTSRVCSSAWNQYILSTGSRSGHIIHHDVRQQQHLIATLSGHSEEVCGLKWAPDGRYLASGANDNVLNIWAASQGALTTDGTPLHQLTAHQSAVKAVAWCPWQSGVLASGGGTADRCIKTWNATTGTCINSLDTKSQVSALVWNSHYKELVSGHGYSNNQLTVWKYPSMKKVAELTGHTARILQLCLSPDETSVLSAGADETLRLWKAFVPDPASKKDKPRNEPTSVLRTGLMR